jgi:hypothetical protein
MPARSKAQFKKMFILYKEKKITKKQLDDFTHGVNYKKLPAIKRKSVPKKGRGKR